MKPYYEHAGITIYHGVDFSMRFVIDSSHEARPQKRLQAIP